jgi:hypothetical protein
MKISFKEWKKKFIIFQDNSSVLYPKIFLEAGGPHFENLRVAAVQGENGLQIPGVATLRMTKPCPGTRSYRHSASFWNP